MVLLAKLTCVRFVLGRPQHSTSSSEGYELELKTFELPNPVFPDAMVNSRTILIIRYDGLQ
jgi:hypothetical protein